MSKEAEYRYIFYLRSLARTITLIKLKMKETPKQYRVVADDDNGGNVESVSGEIGKIMYTTNKSGYAFFSYMVIRKDDKNVYTDEELAKLAYKNVLETTIQSHQRQINLLQDALDVFNGIKPAVSESEVEDRLRDELGLRGGAA